MDKAAAKAVFRAHALPVAEHRVVTADGAGRGRPAAAALRGEAGGRGLVVGVTILREGDNRREAIARAWPHGPRIMAESFVPGRELTVAVMGDRALAVTEIDTGHVFYDYDAKYAEGGSRHVLPAAIHPEVAAEAMRVALAAHRALGCRGVSRSDFRYDDTAGEPGRLVLLEVNTQPGMTPTSLLPEQAAHLGIPFPALCRWIVEQARHGA
jgi:D-alanine-D-alanine ligase